MRNFHKCLCNIYGRATVDRSSVGNRAKKVTASESLRLMTSCDYESGTRRGADRAHKAVEVDGGFVEKQGTETNHHSSLFLIFMI